MALKGTLKDFGIADILQLIGQQQKTGTLVLKSKEQEVQIGFKDGSIVKAESATRRKKELIGNILVRAELITEQQLEEALETQRRTLKRLGDVLVSSKVLALSKFRQMCQLQASETLYGLFQWKSGTYAFEQGELEYDPDALQPLRAEAVLMEGFRMVDEWPMIRKRITSYDMTFEKVNVLPLAPAPRSMDADVDSAFGDGPPPYDGDGVGASERRVFAVVAPNRDVRKLIDLSCLGEFETCKALSSLVSQNYLKPEHHSRRTTPVGASGASARERWISVGAWALSVGLVLTLLVLLAFSVRSSGWGLNLGAPGALSKVELQRFIGRSQMTRISAALNVYRLERGELPSELSALVEAGLLLPDDLRYPWHESYFYRRVDGQRFVLLPPLR